MEPTQIMPMTKNDFWQKYWFTPLQMVTLINSKADDYPFMVEGRNYVIRAGVKEKMPGTVANVYLSQMTRIMAQDDDKMNFLSDFALMKLYYDKLIVDVESLVREVSNVPAYLSDIPESMKVSSEPETPPWQAPKTPENSVPENESGLKNTLEVTPTEKEFEYEGAKYKMIIDKNDKETYFKNGTRISAADYLKTASML